MVNDANELLASDRDVSACLEFTLDLKIILNHGASALTCFGVCV